MVVTDMRQGEDFTTLSGGAVHTPIQDNSDDETNTVTGTEAMSTSGSISTENVSGLSGARSGVSSKVAAGVQIEGYVDQEEFDKGGWRVVGPKQSSTKLTSSGRGGSSRGPSSNSGYGTTFSGSGWAATTGGSAGQGLFNPNKYGNPKAPTSYAGSVASSSAANENRKFPKIRPVKQPTWRRGEEPQESKDNNGDDPWEGVGAVSESDSDDDDHEV